MVLYDTCYVFNINQYDILGQIPVGGTKHHELIALFQQQECRDISYLS